MIYELRTYTFHQGKLNQYLDIARTIGRPARGQNYGVNCGYWTSEFGSLNQIWHLWRYESHEERSRLREELSKNVKWTTEYVPAIRPLMVRQDVRFLNAVYGVTPPAQEGNMYELRTYTFHQGKPNQYLDIARTIGRPRAGRIMVSIAVTGPRSSGLSIRSGICGGTKATRNGLACARNSRRT